MGFPGAHNVRRRPQGLRVARDVSAPRIGDLASPTDFRTTRQNDGRRHPGRSAERHVGKCSRCASTPGAWQGVGYAAPVRDSQRSEARWTLSRLSIIDRGFAESPLGPRTCPDPSSYEISPHYSSRFRTNRRCPVADINAGPMKRWIGHSVMTTKNCAPSS